MSAPPEWLHVRRGEGPLLLSIPHAGIQIPSEHVADFVSPWRARKDADWFLAELYGFAGAMGATIVTTALSRSIIDVNRDPSGASLYPGRASTELCPTTTFDGEPLYHPGAAPDAAAIADRRQRYFAPYHAALEGEIARLRARHERIVLYDCHSIRSEIPRLFAGLLPVFNLGTSDGAACDRGLRARLGALMAASGRAHVTDGRFKGGWITRHHGAPGAGVHAVQMELATRAYLREPRGAVSEADWPPPYDADFAAPLVAELRGMLAACIRFCETEESAP